EMVGHGQGVEPERLGEDRVLQEHLRLELLVSAEVGKGGHRLLLRHPGRTARWWRPTPHGADSRGPEPAGFPRDGVAAHIPTRALPRRRCAPRLRPSASL